MRRSSLSITFLLLVVVAALSLSYAYGSVLHGRIDHRLIALVSLICFVLASIAFLQILTDAIRKKIINDRLGVGRAAALQFIIRVAGYLTILFITLDRFGIAVGHILLGSAVLGIILGVAAQQALANFFASIVLIVAHPFAVGQQVTLVSGSLGGKYVGRIDDIGLTHTKLRENNGNLVKLPNSTILVGAAITVHKNKKSTKLQPNISGWPKK